MKIDRGKVNYILASRGMTQGQLADKMQRKPAQISQVLTRETCLPATAGRIAKALNVGIKDIMPD